MASLNLSIGPPLSAVNLSLPLNFGRGLFLGLIFRNGLYTGQTFLVFWPDHLSHAAEQPHQLGNEGAWSVHGLRHLHGVAPRLQPEFDRIVGWKGPDEVDPDHYACKMIYKMNARMSSKKAVAIGAMTM